MVSEKCDEECHFASGRAAICSAAIWQVCKCWLKKFYGDCDDESMQVCKYANTGSRHSLAIVLMRVCKSANADRRNAMAVVMIKVCKYESIQILAQKNMQVCKWWPKKLENAEIHMNTKCCKHLRDAWGGQFLMGRMQCIEISYACIVTSSASQSLSTSLGDPRKHCLDISNGL